MSALACLVWAAALLFGAALPIAGVPLGLAFLGTVVLVRRHVGVLALLVAGLLLLAAAERSRSALIAFETRRAEVRDQLGERRRCAGRGEVRSSPTLAHGVMRTLVAFDALDCEGARLDGSVRARLYGGPRDLGRGARVEVVAQLAPVRPFRNVGTTNPLPALARQGVVLSGAALHVEVLESGTGYAAIIDHARAYVRSRIAATFAADAQPMARALVLGENDLEPGDDEAFRASGLAHLLAVSGTHLVFAVVALVQAVRACLLRVQALALRVDVTRLASALGVLLSLGYADFSGGSGSAWRAAWMLVLVFATHTLGRKPNAIRIVALTVGVGVLVDPLVVFDVSFMLSLAATLGLLTLGQSWMKRVRRVKWAVPRYVAMSMVATVSSMLPCVPLLAGISPELTLAGLFANVVAAPIGELFALPVCLLHAVSCVIPPLERGLALVGSGALLSVRSIARVSAAQEALAFRVPEPDSWHLGLAVLATVGALEAVSLGRRSLAIWWVLAGAFSLWVLERGHSPSARARHRLSVSMLDVGQGDATLFQFPSGETMLVDGGGFVGSPIDTGQRVLLPVLRARRLKRLDVVVLSHPHPDHFGGLLTLAEKVPIGEFWNTRQGEVEGAGPAYAALVELLRQRGTKLVRPATLCRSPRRFADVTVRVMAPCPHYAPDRSANDNSFVLRVSYGTRVFLMMGDAERREERSLARLALGADVLKVGHHGSRTSTSARFLRQVRPTFATISSGVRNRFGHPHPKTLKALRAARVRTLRLDRMGGVEFTTNGKNLETYAFSFPY